MALSRRGMLAAAGGMALAAPAVVRAQAARPDKLMVFAHRIHKQVATTGKGGDITAAWSRRTGVEVEWVTFEIGPLGDRLFREASLDRTSVDVGFVLNTQATERLAKLFEPLGPLMAHGEPVENMGDIFPGLLQGMEVGGALYGIPFRHASSGLHYNEAIFAERGVAGPPATVEDLIAIAKTCTFRRNGQPVSGFVMGGLGYADVIAFARAWDGDFITPALQVACNQPPMVTAVAALREMYEAGAIPRSIAAIRGEDVNTWMQTGRSATIIAAMGRNAIYNDPQKSSYPGQIKTVPFPVARALAGRYAVAPTKVEFWGMAIPRSSAHKELAMSFIRAMAGKEATVLAALNGNGPVRNSAYDDPRIREVLPYAEAERNVLRVSRVAIPAFENAARAGDALEEEAQAAVLGMKSPQKAMDDLAERTRKLLG